MSYSLLYATHVAAVAVSVALFVFRGALMLREAPLLQSKPLRIAPHVIDTVLLVSALALAAMIHQYPFVDGWLTAKVAGLVAYVVLGTIALKRGRTKRIRIAAFIAALAVIGYVVRVALVHSAWPL
jgi:uncharacterized membrane protein SirB2